MDWWAFGVFVFEMIAGFPPFYDDDVTNTYKKILSGRFSFPSHFSVSSRDLVRKLLQVADPCTVRHMPCYAAQPCTAELQILQADLSKRFGCLAGGVSDIKAHAWFKSTDWNTLLNKEQDPPIKSVWLCVGLAVLRSRLRALLGNMNAYNACRPTVKGADDHSNFDDYSTLPPLKHEFELSQSEQLMFSGF